MSRPAPALALTLAGLLTVGAGSTAAQDDAATGKVRDIRP